MAGGHACVAGIHEFRRESATDVRAKPTPEGAVPAIYAGTVASRFTKLSG
jgi:hypothetical protein